MKPKITWKNGSWYAVNGYAAGLKLFSIDTEARPLRLTARIGTEKFLKPKFETVDEAKFYATLYLKSFLEEIEYE